MNYNKDYDIRKEFKVALKGHISHDTAYMDKRYCGNSQQYNYRLYWIDRTSKGERLCHQSTQADELSDKWYSIKLYEYNWVECLYLDQNGDIDSYGFSKNSFKRYQVQIMKKLFFSVMDDHQKHIVDGLLKYYKEQDKEMIKL